MPLNNAAIRVAAVVVTLNRLDLLKRCLKGIREQTPPVDKIVVVDHGSSDGTLAFLREEPGIELICQRNGGSAGGVATGLIEAFRDTTITAAWVMDDDGMATPGCLEKLSAVLELGFLYAAPNIVTEEGVMPLSSVLEACSGPYVQHVGGPFNGILLARELVVRIGLPLRSMFIWGDEFEFTDRVEGRNIPVVLVRDAIYTHKFTPLYKAPSGRLWYYSRNQIVRAARFSCPERSRRTLFRLLRLGSIFKLVVYFTARLRFDVLYKVVSGALSGIIFVAQGKHREIEPLPSAT